MRNKQIKSFIALALLSVALMQQAGCKKKKEEGELITSVVVHLFKNSTAAGTFYWKDKDGDGGNPPAQIDTIMLDSGSIYNVKLDFLDESGTEIKDITSEIKQEATNHLVCFTSTPSYIKIKPTDSDGQFPIGLEAEFTGNSKGFCNLRIVLRHQPGVKNGTCDPGDTDVDVTFPVRIK